MTGEAFSAPAVGGQNYVERSPLPALREFAALVWVQQVGRDAAPYVHRHIPNGAVELVCRVGSAPQVIGPLTEPVVEVLEPGTTVVGMRFAPGAFPAVAGQPASEVAGLAVDAEELWGRSAAALGEAVGTATSPQEALSAVQFHVHERVRLTGEPPDPLVSEAVRGLMPWRTADVTSLSASLYISETQLRRRCRTAVGLAPKALHRILRFQGFLALVQRAIAEGRAPTDDGLALLALRAGFADQSHLTRECVRLTGVSPRVFLAETQQACACGHDHSASFGPVLMPIAAAGCVQEDTFIPSDATRHFRTAMTPRPGRTGKPSSTRGFDPRTPSIARVYDYLLGGKDNFAADRAVAEKLIAVYPPIIETVPESRRFVERAITWVAGQGITQFIDLGAGLPTDPNTHVTAQAASPTAAVAYVDNDPVVISHLTALLAHHGNRIAVIAGDLHDHGAILGDAGLRAMIDLSKPVCVIMGMILHFDTLEAAAELVKRYISAVASGSYLIATIASGKGSLAAKFYETYNASGFATIYNHSSADFASLFGDLEILPPGLGDARRIRPGWSELASVPRRPDRVLAGIARVP